MNIVITGCSSGIGLETAKYLKERFVRVYPTARKKRDVEMLKELGFEDAMLLDVTKPATIAEVIKYVLEKEGRIDAWFNNAGYGQPGAIEDVETKVLKAQFETNVFGLHECTRQVLKVMLMQGEGKIIQHSSILGLVSLFGRGAYNASKYAIEGLTDTLRLELEGTGVYVSLLNTGPIESRFRDNAKAMLQKHIDIEHSRFKERYRQSLAAQKSNVPFSEGAESVAKVVHKILLEERPAPRYYITKATWILAIFKRLLPTSLMDKVLQKVG